MDLKSLVVQGISVPEVVPFCSCSCSGGAGGGSGCADPDF